jgi:imidazoleglycerol-phosphate dehydratase/histidinol-phosphatase
MKKYLFLDRDGTLLVEPPDFQVDRIEKFCLVSGVVSSLQKLTAAGYSLVMVTNQDGLGSPSYPESAFLESQSLLVRILQGEGVFFDETLICPHFEDQGCNCRKPATGLVRSYLGRNDWDRTKSFVIGDRDSDVRLAENLGLRSYQIGRGWDWHSVTTDILTQPRRKTLYRKTSETEITVGINVDGCGRGDIATGLAFFDHMLDQIARHSGIDLTVKAIGDLQVDEHHLIEDTALLLGQALSDAVSDRQCIGRYGFWLPLDEALAKVALDFSRRPVLVYRADLRTERTGGVANEMFKHFFKSFSDGAGVSLHIEATGENSHHIVESMFKGLGKVLRQVVALDRSGVVQSTKGLL